MCTAMAQAQSSSLARSCVDQFNPSVRNGLEAYHFPSRRPSLAPSAASTSSSPESMIMDTSARTSRSSSIASVSSAGWAPNPATLARFATCRSARLPYPALQKCQEVVENTPEEPASSPDFESFHIEDFSSFTAIAHAMTNRKRGRSSADLHQNVRNLLSKSQSNSSLRGLQAVLPDRSVAESFVLSSDRSPACGPKGLQSCASAVRSARYPLQKDLGRKRTCCGAQTLNREGPGMWAGIL